MSGVTSKTAEPGVALDRETDILRVVGLKKHFESRKGLFSNKATIVRAVDGVEFNVCAGETVGLVGESGSGKTTLGRMIVRAIEPTEGRVALRGPDDEWLDLTALKGAELRKTRRHYQMIFQDPYSSLNPRMTVLDLVKEPLVYNGIADKEEAVERVREMLSLVGLDGGMLRRYPHAFSGGQRQRIGIARALVTSPRFVVCDEPVSALDVSVQAQILNLLDELQQQFGLSYLFIAHDLSVVGYIAHRIAVMYAGRIVELADTASLFRSPRHPYTEALLSNVPVADPQRMPERIILQGETANPAAPPSGCAFHPRCRHATDICKMKVPPWKEVAAGHSVACHHAELLSLRGIDDAEPVPST